MGFSIGLSTHWNFHFLFVIAPCQHKKLIFKLPGNYIIIIFIKMDIQTTFQDFLNLPVDLRRIICHLTHMLFRHDIIRTITGCHFSGCNQRRCPNRFGCHTHATLVGTPNDQHIIFVQTALGHDKWVPHSDLIKDISCCVSGYDNSGTIPKSLCLDNCSFTFRSNNMWDPLRKTSSFIDWYVSALRIQKEIYHSEMYKKK